MQVAQFRAKTIEGIQITSNNVAEVMEWCGGEPAHDPGCLIALKSWAGTWMLARLDDWVVIDEDGWFRVITPREFNKRYEPV